MHMTSFRTRYGETDKMGIIYHPNYYVYFEIGRTEYLRDEGFVYKEMEEQGVMMPLVETHCKYIIPVKYDEAVTVRTIIKDMTVARIVFGYKLHRDADGALLAEGETVQAFTNLNGRPVSLKKMNPIVFEKLFSLIERE